MKCTVLVLFILATGICGGEHSVANNGSDLDSALVSVTPDQNSKPVPITFQMILDAALPVGSGYQSLPDVVAESYAGNVENVGKVVQILKVLPYCSQRAMGHQILLEAMVRDGNQNRSEILLINELDWHPCRHSFSALRSELNGYRNAVISQWARQIHSGDFENITGFFYNNNDIHSLNILDLNLPELVLEAYARNVSNVKNILAFLYKMPTCKEAEVGHKVLFEEMKNSGNSGASEIFLLPGTRLICDFTFRFLNSELKESITNLISEWAAKVRSGAYHKILEFFKRYDTAGNRYAISLSLPELVNVAYNHNLANFENVLHFLHRLPNCDQEEQAHSFLFDAMRISGHLRNPEVLLLGQTGSSICYSYSYDAWKYDLSGYVKEVVSTMASKIYSGNYSEFTEFFEKYEDYTRSRNLNMCQPEFENEFYEKLADHANELETLLKSLPTSSGDTMQAPPHKSETTAQMWNEEAFEKVLEFLSATRPDDEGVFLVGCNEKYKVQNIINKLLSQLNLLKIRKMVWGKVCSIKNVLEGGYLTQGDNTSDGLAGEREVLLVPQVQNLTSGGWKLKANGNGFQLQVNGSSSTGIDDNLKSPRVMVMGDESQRDKGRREVITVNGVSDNNSQTWELVPHATLEDNFNNTKHVFYLRRTSFMESYVLYADGNSSVSDVDDNKIVYAYISTGPVYPVSAQWEIECL